MSTHPTITNRILQQLRRSPEWELEEFVLSLREFTWHDILVELIRLNRRGQVEMKTYRKGICSVGLYALRATTYSTVFATRCSP